MLLSLSPVKINGLIITASDTVLQPAFPWASPACVPNGVTLWAITQIVLSPTNAPLSLCSPTDLHFSVRFSPSISGSPWGMPLLPLDKSAPRIPSLFWACRVPLGASDVTLFLLGLMVFLCYHHVFFRALALIPGTLLVPELCGGLWQDSIDWTPLCYSVLCVHVRRGQGARNL